MTPPGELAEHPVERRSLSRRTKIVMAIALGSSVLALAILPLTLMTLPDPHPYRLDSLVGERSGTYVTAADGYYRLYPYAAPLFSFPSDAFVVDSAQPTITIKFRQADNLALYSLQRYGADTPLDVQKTRVNETTLELRPSAPLAAGEYVITAPRDSVDEEIDNFYFRVPG